MVSQVIVCSTLQQDSSACITSCGILGMADKISTVDSSDKMDTAGAAAADSQPPDDGSTLPTAVIVLGMAGSGKSSLMQV